MSVEYLLKRLPFALIVWLIGGATCGFVLYALAGNAAALSVSDFSLVTTYLPYVVVIVCTLVCIIGSEQSFASLVWSIVFSVVLVMVFLYAVSVFEADPTVAAALLANSEEGTTLNPAFHDSTRVGIRFLVSALLPLIVAMVFNWIQKKRHPELAAKGKKSKSKKDKDKKNKGKDGKDKNGKKSKK